MKIIIISIILVIGFLGLSYGPVMSRAYPAERIRITSELRTLSTSLLSYYAYTKGQYPDTLQQLVEKGLATQEQLSPNGYTLHYVKGLTVEDDDKIILYTSEFESDYESDKGKVICSRVDGSTEKIDKTELEKQLKEQSLPKQDSSSQD